MGKFQTKQLKKFNKDDKCKKIEKKNSLNTQQNFFCVRNIQTRHLEASVLFPILQIDPQHRVQGSATTLINLPKFKNDKLFFTPSFVLADELLTKTNLKQEKEIFKIRSQIDNSNNEDAIMLFPVPDQPNGNCMVCRQKFPNYRQHISRKSHIDKIKRSPYNLRINEFCVKYELERFFKGADDCQETINQQINQVDIRKFSIIFDKNDTNKRNKDPEQTKQALYLKLKEQLKNQQKNKKTVNPMQTLSNNNIFDVLQF